MQKSLPNIEPWGCHGLFSEHYIEKRFPETEQYLKFKAPDRVWENVQVLVQKNINSVATKNEAQLEEALIRPLLREMGVIFIPAVGVPQGEVDYAFYASEEEKRAADVRYHEKYKGAIALADAKRWDRPFNKGGGTEQDENPNAVPTKQIANYIFKTGIEWGVLTNGRIWRLYNRNVVPVDESYFWMNLLGALEERDTFNLFYALFSGAAFAGKVQEYVLKESESYWADIGVDLKEKAYEALELLCNGFRKLDGGLEIKDIYEGAVILLYRLLFILYAENKKLLPRDDEAYKRYSLESILDEVDRGRTETFSETRAMLYDRLRHLFRLIDEGDESLSVYQYNGGLFKEDGLPFLPANFLSDHSVPDRYLAKALTLIAYAENKKKLGRHRVDYGELDVRHLGSIYEGLLEFHPQRVNGKIELFTDKGERKATGSYYTPGYIVDYIVENTLGPLTEKAAAPEDVLGIKVLDPAMGSGHFLVGAVDFIGRRCVELAGEKAEKSGKEYQREAVERCVYGVDLNPLAVELTKLSLWLHTVAKDKPLSFLDHHLKLGNSLVGARIADLGEIPTKGKKKEEAAATQNLFATRLEQAMRAAINEVMGILSRETKVIEDITFKEESFQRAGKRLAPFKAVADTWVGTYFGLDITETAYAETLDALARNAEDVLALAHVHEAIRMSHGDEHGVGREFFHWELEFPEVFYDGRGQEKDNPGFDAVIGNPPYGKISDNKTIAFIKNNFGVTTADMAAYFLEVGAKQTGSFLSFIVPKSIAFYETWKNVREIISNKLFLQSVADVGIGFEEVILEQIILVYAQNTVPQIKVSRFEPLRSYALKKEISNEGYFPKEIVDLTGIVIFAPINVIEERIIKKIKKNSVFIDEIAESIFGNINLTNIKRALGKEEREILIGPYKDYPRKPFANQVPFVRRDPDLARYLIRRWYLLEVPDGYSKLPRVTSPRLFIKPLRGSRLVAGVDLRGSFATHHHMISVIFQESSGYSLLFALAIINSKIPSFWLMKTIFSGTTETARELNQPYFSKIPLPRIDFTTGCPSDVTAYIREYENSGIRNIVELIRRSGKTKNTHDFLAYLAQQLLVMNAEKQRVSGAFLGWLDGETAGNLDDFRPKKFQDFWEYDFDEFYKWLKKNGESFSASDHAELQTEFEKYKTRLVGLYEKIEYTDRLIDDIVYILYGLSEEEIRTVENSFNDKAK
jgi:type I restriction-modification system DNA methylase subunit